MAKIKLNGDTSGYIEISAPAVSGNNTLELGPGTKILTNLDNTFTGVSTFTSGLHVTGGNLGVGTNNPDATLKVNVASGNNGVVVQNTSTANIALFGARNGDATIQVGQWGSTASGTTFGLSNANMAFIYTTTYNTTHPSALALGTISNKPIVFATNNTERLRITSDGDVLIADTTNAIYDDSTGGGMNLKANGQLVLKKQASSTADPLMWLNDTGQTTNKFILFAQDGNEKASIGLAGNDLRFARDGYNETLRITSAGNVGINKAPETDWASSYRAIEIGNSSVSAYQGSSYPSIELNMNCRGTQASYGAGWKYILGMRATQIHMPYSGETLFRRANSGSADGAISWNESMRITSDGDVGIGENSPADRLVVQKTNASGDVAVRIKNDTLTDGSASTPTTASLYLNTSTGDFNSFYIQARRYDNDTHFGYSNPRDGGHTPNMIITNEGQIKTPKQPSFFSRPAGGYNFSTAQVVIGGTWTDVHNIGSHFSNGTFTAPIAGTYQFSWSLFSQSETTRLDAFILVNGTNVMREEINGYPSTPANKSGSVHGCYYLSANDYVTFGVYSAGTTNIYSSAAPWSYACGFLVG